MKADQTLIRLAIGMAIRSLREERQVSATKLGEAAGISSPTLSKMENGLRELTLFEAMALTHAMGCDVTKLSALAEKLVSTGAVKQRITAQTRYEKALAETHEAITVALKELQD
jgi:transcriptional regulator with XRE-family HTH domain